MTHPSADEVALHLEGLLAPADERRIGDHLRECAECAATARDLGTLPEALRTAAAGAATPPMPQDVAHRIESALRREAAHRRADEPAQAAGPADTGARVGERDEVPLLDERRRRRRRVLAGGLLAAASVTVVGVGLGQLVQTGGSADSAAGRAQESAAAADRPSGRAVSPAGRPGQRGDAASLSPGSQALREEQNRDPGAFGITGETRSGMAGLIEGVAAAHAPERPRHDRLACVRSALGVRGDTATGIPGPLASYAVRLPGAAGSVPGVVVLRPSEAPSEGLLLSCGPRPQMLLRRGLDR